MGADLICFILKGPVELDASLKPAAIDQGRKMLACAQRLQEMLDADCQQSDMIAHAREHCPELLICLEPGTPDERFVLDEDALMDLDGIDDPEQLVEDFFTIWEKGARDAHCRLDPDDETQVIRVAGDMSWGDEPDGWAYQTFKKLACLGMLHVLGIR